MHRKTLLLILVIAASVVLVVGVLSRGPARAPGKGSLASSTYAIDTTSRTAVNHAFQTRWLPAMNAGPGWTGSVSGCRKGSVASSYVTRLGNALNFARALNKVDPIWVGADRYSSSSSYSTQAGALLMHANQKLSHDPPSSWTCWTRPADEAAHLSNLCLTIGDTLSAGRAVERYLDDSGSSNSAVGHRRWLLAPRVRAFYAGATPNANLLMPVLASSSTPRTNPAFTAWPSQGWFPTQLEPAGRWSWSSREPNADLSGARVQVWSGSTPVAVRQYAAHNGYGQPTLVWQLPSTPARVGNWTVQVSGVRSSTGVLRPATRYAVRLFTSWKE